MTLKNTLLAAALCAASACAAALPKGLFTTDFDAAAKRAAAENKPLFVLFTGSDWCPWCIRLENEVLSQKAFADAAAAFVPVYLDFPNDDARLTPDQARRNRQLAQKYGVRGFPTVLILDGTGVVVAKTGYRKGGAAAYAKHLQSLLAGTAFDVKGKAPAKATTDK